MKLTEQFVTQLIFQKNAVVELLDDRIAPDSPLGEVIDDLIGSIESIEATRSRLQDDVPDSSVDLDELEESREFASDDKVDLFDFYHRNWDRLVAEIRRLRA